MIPKASDLNTSVKNWKQEKGIHIQLKLLLDDTKKIVGYANCYGFGQKIGISARIGGNAWNEFKDIPYTTNMNTIHKAWEECMNKLLEKLFK